MQSGADKIILIAGLGNPGDKYKITRHNVGFLLLDFVREKIAPSHKWKLWRTLGVYILIDNFAPDRKIFLVKPMTYMNDSGKMLCSFTEFHKINPESMLVCYDDVSLNLGKIRIRNKGTSGGHKGMESILETYSSNHVPRLRIGIGPKPAGIDSRDYVLSRFTNQEMKMLETTLKKSCDAIISIIEKNIDFAMNLFNYDNAAD
jgi:PTH1 family peptidyl-tRNA hydrolase